MVHVEFWLREQSGKFNYLMELLVRNTIRTFMTSVSVWWIWTLSITASVPGSVQFKSLPMWMLDGSYHLQLQSLY